MTTFASLFNSFQQIKVGVVGDVMLDSYLWGKVERVSPEAPVPVVSVTKKENRIGGAGNVALNVAALNAPVFLITVIGNDDNGLALKTLLEENTINTNYLVKSSERVTTQKTRVISRNQQMMRLDEEVTNDINEAEQQKLLAAIEHFIVTENPAIIILEDYNKGVLTASGIKQIIALCKKYNVITSVDPKAKNFFEYKGVDIFKPNLREVTEGLHVICEDVTEAALQNIHRSLHEKLQHQISFITLSEKGVFYQQHQNSRVVPSHFRNIADVSGAGDTVIAVASLVYAATNNTHLMAEMANIAGGLVCEIVGTSAIDKLRLQKECERLLQNT